MSFQKNFCLFMKMDVWSVDICKNEKLLKFLSNLRSLNVFLFVPCYLEVLFSPRCPCFSMVNPPDVSAFQILCHTFDFTHK